MPIKRKYLYIILPVVFMAGIIFFALKDESAEAAAKALNYCVDAKNYFYTNIGSFDRSRINENDRDEAKLLYEYYGRDAKCDTGSEEEKRMCHLNRFIFGWPGTFRLAGNLIIHGANIFNYGADSAGLHWIMSGLYEGINNAIGFSNKENKVLFGRNVFTDGSFIMPAKGNNSIAFSGKNKVSINGKQDASGEELSFYVATGNVLSLRDSNQSVVSVVPTGAETGFLSVGDFFKADKISFRGERLKYCDCGNISCSCSGEVKNCSCRCDNEGKCVCECAGCECAGYSAEYNCDEEGACLPVYKCRGLGNVCAKSGEKMIIR
ncbi:MAG: hypothetical protein WCW25_03390 [Patescibacteria group bacterium]|jgi:hypothetical protein